ncbi:MAG: hypothetical protein NTW03_04770, partial [Verrucomicrobia bacterium]|nr:hypothetical protein [Verrucomicrobiota bacterium]
TVRLAKAVPSPAADSKRSSSLRVISFFIGRRFFSGFSLRIQRSIQLMPESPRFWLRSKARETPLEHPAEKGPQLGLTPVQQGLSSSEMNMAHKHFPLNRRPSRSRLGYQ